MSPDKEEVQRLLDILRTLLRMLGVSNREVERRLELRHSAVTRLFSGQVEAKLELVLGIVRVVGLGYDEFFGIVYPGQRQAGEETDAAKRIGALLADLAPRGPRPAPAAAGASEPPAAAEPSSREELLRDLRQAVRDVLHEVNPPGRKGPKKGNGQ